MQYSGISLVTTAPAAIMEWLPMVTPSSMTALLPIQQSSPIFTPFLVAPWSFIGLSTSEKLNIDKENLKTIKIDLDYINEILDTWVIDFGLNEKQKEIIEKEIADQAKLKWEAPENEI